MDMTPDNAFIEICESKKIGYNILTQFQSWRVAVINNGEELIPDPVIEMQKHDLTDEAFILIKGKCVLAIADGEDAPENITLIRMESQKLYNVKRSVWHACIRFPDSAVIVVENSETSLSNSPVAPLTTQQVIELRENLSTLNETYMRYFEE